MLTVCLVYLVYVDNNTDQTTVLGCSVLCSTTLATGGFLIFPNFTVCYFRTGLTFPVALTGTSQTSMWCKISMYQTKRYWCFPLINLLFNYKLNQNPFYNRLPKMLFLLFNELVHACIFISKNLDGQRLCPGFLWPECWNCDLWMHSSHELCRADESDQSIDPSKLHMPIWTHQIVGYTTPFRRNWPSSSDCFIFISLSPLYVMFEGYVCLLSDNILSSRVKLSWYTW